ncbi:Uncharacterised protein [Mycobacteroides abscessus subsp. abscessus]|nr:Uncharacterised protein [Mycobacteroides abscessus subsp. abscessus]
MMIAIYFIIGSLYFLYYGIKLKNDKKKDISFPFIVSFLLFLFGTFSFFDYVIGKVIVGIPLIIFIFGNKFLRKMERRKKA